MPQSDSTHTTTEPSARRSFLTRAAAVVMGGIVVVFPFAASWGVFVDPLRRRRNAKAGNGAGAVPLVRVCTLDALPADGTPRLFPVVTDVVDAWSRTPGQRIGSVFLTRTDADGRPTVTCFTSTCPHLGCAVDYHANPGQYECPCHASGFAKDGQKIFGPSLRRLDPLDVKLVDQNGRTEVMVAFQRFRAGVAERIPIG
jgi:menaquinol-cytochrome c reductase iron-sulfur subunit